MALVQLPAAELAADCLHGDLSRPVAIQSFPVLAERQAPLRRPEASFGELAPIGNESQRL